MTKIAKRVLVIQYEQFFEVDDVGDISTVIRETLDHMRESAGARVVGSYDADDDVAFRAKAKSHINISAPINIEID